MLTDVADVCIFAGIFLRTFELHLPFCILELIPRDIFSKLLISLNGFEVYNAGILMLMRVCSSQYQGWKIFRVCSPLSYTKCVQERDQVWDVCLAPSGDSY